MGVSVTEQDAVVTNLVGQLKAKDEQGNIRDVTIGDLIKDGEQLIFAPNSQFILHMADGTIITETNFSEPIPESSLGAAPELATAPVSADAEIAALQAQILAGDDPTAGLPETAAGTAAGGGGNQGGSDYITLGRTGDETLAGSGYDTAGFALAPAPTEDPVILTAELPEPPTIDASSVTLLEANLLQGSNPLAAALEQSNSLQVGAQTGISALTINGIDIFIGGLFVGPITLTTDNGVLVITSFDAVTGTLNYNFTLDTDVDNSASDTLSQIFTTLVTDLAGITTASTITVNIIDDSPNAVDDSNTVSENGDIAIVITGNVLANDTQGADSAVVSQISNTDVATQAIAATTNISGDFGLLQISADGSYTYQLDNSLGNVQALAQGELVTETFTYQLADSDGDTVAATLTITITGTNDIPVIVVIDPDVPVDPDNPVDPILGAEGLVVEAGNEDDGTVVSGVLNTTGLFEPADVDNGAVLVWSGDATGSLGSFTIDPVTGEWSYTLDNSLADSLAEGDTVQEIFIVTVTDEFDATATQQVTITVQGTNDSPIITSSDAAATGTVVEASTLDDETLDPGIPQTSGLLTATDVDNGAQLSWSGNSAGTYGSFSIDSASGSWVYNLDNDLADSLAEGEVILEEFLVTVTDEFGATDTQLVTITVIGTNDAPQITSTSEDAEGVVIETGNADNGTVLPGVLISTGTLDAGDIDNNAVLIFSGSTDGSFGSFFIDPVTGEWTYTLDDSLADSFAEGQSTEEVFLVTVTDEFGLTSTQNVTITVQGTNDSPIIFLDEGDSASGTVIESGSEDDGVFIPGIDVINGTLSVEDVDTIIADNPIWSFTPQSNNYGVFNLNSTTGEWTYNLNNNLADPLAEGESAEETFLVTVTDEFGATDTQLVTITVQGTNDLPILTVDIEGGVTKDANNTTLSDSGILSFTDVDTSNTHSVSEDYNQDIDWSNGDITSVLTQGEITSLIDGFSVDSNSWDYSIANSLVQFLGADETITLSFEVTVTDNDDGTDTETVSITIFGTNSLPELTVEGTGAVLEDFTNPDLNDFGAISFTDADVSDTHEVTEEYKGDIFWTGGTLSNQLIAQDIDILIDGFTVDDDNWDYTIPNALVQFLAVGETITLSFDVTVTDNRGGSDTEPVTITITGTNDIPIITSSGGAHLGSVKEEGVVDDFDNDPNNNNTPADAVLQTGGTVTAEDADHNAILTWSGDESGTYGEFTIDSVSGEWVYALNDSVLVNALASGESHDEIFTVTVTDEFGATDTQNITVTVNGTNDIPVITSSGAAHLGSVKEEGVVDDFDNDPNNNNAPADAVLQTGGTVTAEDADNNSSLAWSGDDSGTYGEFTIDSVSGEWVYALNDSVLVNALASGESHDEIFTVTVTDEFGATDTQNITVTVNGTNDIPVITSSGAAHLGSVKEEGVVDDFDNDPNNNNAPADAVLQTGGTVTAEDADNNSSLAWSGDDSGTYGEFTIDSVSGEWVYALNDSVLVNALASGESHDEIFTVTVTDEFGATDTQNITVTVNGTNDIPVITSSGAAHLGSVKEEGVVDDFDNDPNNNNTPADAVLQTGGTVTAEDADNNSSLAWSGDDSGTYGEFTIDSVSGEWVYALNDSVLVNALASGESHDEIFTVTVTDEFGATDTQNITVTVNGTNDIPVITSSGAAHLGSVKEEGVVDDFDNDPNNNNTPADAVLQTGGTVTAEDADNNSSLAWSGDDSGTYGEFTIDSVSGEWVYALNDSVLVNALASGESHDEIFTVTVTDEFGATDTQNITVTVNGTNDIPVITSSGAAHLGSVKEEGVVDDFDNDPNNNNAPADAVLQTGGTVTAEDADNNSSLAWSGDDSGTYGEFTIDSVSGEWVYALNDSVLVNALASGESHDEIFTVTVTDEFGATDTQNITVTVNGTNDIPVITSSGAAHLGSVKEEGVVDDFDNDPNNNNTPADAVLQTGGTVTAEDADNNSSLAWSGDDSGTYGEFTIDSVSGEWVYALNDSVLVNALASGESHDEIFTVTVTDEFGATDTQNITVTVNGTNDIPVITSSGAAHLGSVKEEGVVDDFDNDPNNNNAPADAVLQTGGTVTAEDADNNSSLAWSGDDSGTYGEFTIDSVSGEWVYALNDSVLVNALASGESHDEIFTVTVTDEFGATDTQNITVTVNGTNDIPVITSSGAAHLGSVKEEGVVDDFDNDPNNNNTPADAVLQTGGTVTAEDADNNSSLAWSGDDSGTYGEFTIDSVSGEWVYALNDSVLVNALASGESHDEIFTVTVTDEFGATDTQNITVTVNGTNDIPVITSSGAAHLGSVKEEGVVDDFDNDPNNNNTPADAVLQTGGTVTAEDADNNSSLAWSGDESGTYGEFTIDSVSGEWVYVLNDSVLVNALASGESHDEIFTVTVTDEFGATDTQNITVTVNGTNDIPILTIDDLTGGITEDDTDPNLNVVGTLSFTDVDNNDTPSIDTAPVGDVIWSGGDLTPGQIIDLIAGFSVDTSSWDYTIANSLVQFLAENETITLNFDVTVTDDFGATDTETVVITITGINDAPIVEGISSLLVSEEGLTGGIIDTDGDPSDDTDAISHMGTLTFTDAENPADNSFTVSLIAPISSAFSAGEEVIWQWDGSNILTGRTEFSDTLVMTVTLGTVSSALSVYSVSYTLDLFAPLDHPVNSTEDLLSIDFGVNIFDGFDNVATTLNAIIEDDSPVDEVDELLMQAMTNAVSEFVTGDLFDPGADGLGSITFTVETSGLTYNGTPLVYNMSGNILTASADGTDVFTVTAILDIDGHYDYKLEILQILDAGVSVEYDLSSAPAGNNAAYYVDVDGQIYSQDNQTTMTIATITGTDGGASSSINSNNHGIGVGPQTSISTDEAILFVYGTNGASLAAVSLGNNNNGNHTGTAEISYLVSYTDNTNSGPILATINGTLDIEIIAENNLNIASIEITYLSGNDFQIIGLSSIDVLLQDPINIELSYTATDADGDSVIFDTPDEGHFFVTLDPIPQPSMHMGSALDDVLIDGQGDSYLIGGIGSDSLDGGADTDRDIFVWDLGSDDGSTDTVYNFDSSYDALNLAEILVGEDNTAISLDDYLDFNFVNGNTEIYVDSDGLVGGVNLDLTIIIDGVDLSTIYAPGDIAIIDGLLTDNALIIDTIP
ncbi:retention module-containing protein [Shewanella violacea]|nr:retention module-containing protein [Shewanella violacea]